MVDLLLLVGRLLLVALLYLFLFVVMRTGIGLVKGQNKKAQAWTLTVERGPKTLRGVKLTVNSPIVVGRAPGSDILIPDGVVSGRHACFKPMGTSLMVEDLDSTNGTRLNNAPVHGTASCQPGDVVGIGNAEIRVGRK